MRHLPVRVNVILKNIGISPMLGIHLPQNIFAGFKNAGLKSYSYLINDLPADDPIFIENYFLEISVSGHSVLIFNKETKESATVFFGETFRHFESTTDFYQSIISKRG